MRAPDVPKVLSTTRTFWSRVTESFLIAFGALFFAQMAQLQEAVNAGDWQTVKKVGVSILFAGVIAIFKAVWLVFVGSRDKAAHQALRGGR